MILDKFSLKGKVGIVTGGGQGLGKAFCTAFAEAGANLVIAEMNPDTGFQAMQDIARLGREVLFVQTDIRKRADIDAMVAKTMATFGRIDFLMNNAGIVKWGEAENVSEEDWRNVLDVNLNGLFFCCQAVGKQMIAQQKGSIINIASMSGLIANFPQCQASYNTSKAAVIHLTKSLAYEWARHNVRVNAIAPGYMNTPMAEPFFKDPDYGGKWLEAIPMRRPGEPGELTGAAVMLVSDASSYITGTTVVIDGGYTIL